MGAVRNPKRVGVLLAATYGALFAIAYGSKQV